MEEQQWLKEIVLKIIFDLTQSFYLNFSAYLLNADKEIERDKKNVTVTYKGKFLESTKVQNLRRIEEKNQS